MMTDPWADERERIAKNKEMLEGDAIGDIGKEFQRVRRELDCSGLLADADVLLKMLHYAQHKDECQIARAWGNGPGGTFTDPHCNCGFEKALSALPEHLKTTPSQDHGTIDFAQSQV